MSSSKVASPGSGGKELALELEAKGYKEFGWTEEEVKRAQMANA